MRVVSFFLKSIFIYLIAIFFTSCSTTNIDEEISNEINQEELQILDEGIPIQNIDKSKVKIPTNG